MTPEQEAAWAAWHAEVARIVAAQNQPAPAPQYPPGTIVIDLATGAAQVVGK